ncbi:hypothetical protein [Pseudosulfitobacter pseudonitzschiae]|uniref:hypothetical protein n=1 Tax=Pseudosulfitobacter pseudonitzschiae TaxID=1402135 RepID=UPI001AF4312A|nr:hypothetical protein [Pseudosulfitobacter pseudonitzschiae]MBM1814040.1 hypothetical protein [Pseudosulfitobacter pseudonitzschiae]MBM1831033.1 hypothetical protein [Pseudosulfitobacter pseudonitzschiae]MBM1835900.1 hypothetical protein [Pseudosulfitobacter pseudonitzschiae]MBM1840746.1 hypothetical protein [Pseudosulfitobacter pseudonitzschiae]MBM1845266.1 hypothetical protein [Pseudosulfitobacter pseudonitzschiae]
MLRSIQKLALAAALAATLAPAAFADGESTNEHTVMVLGASFFPRVTYASPGDTVRFINASEAEQSIVAKDENWTVGPIAIEGEEIFTVFAGMKNDFSLVLAEDADEEAISNASGAISFSTPPLGN